MSSTHNGVQLGQGGPRTTFPVRNFSFLGGDVIKKGDDCVGRGDFTKARKYYKKASKQCPEIAAKRLAALPPVRTFVDKMDFKNSLNFRQTLKKTPLFTTAQSYGPKNPLSEPSGRFFNQTNDTPATPISGYSPIQPDIGSHNLQQLPPLTSTINLGRDPIFPTVATNSNNTSSTSYVGSANELVDTYFKASEGPEKEAINNKIRQVIAQFDSVPICIETIQELVVLSAVPDRVNFVCIVNQLLKRISENKVLMEELLQGLAVIFSSMSDKLDFRGRHGAFANILDVLATCLKGRHSDGNSIQLQHILLSISSLLNAMVSRKVFSLDRVGVFDPLKIQLNVFCYHDDYTVSFLASFAKEALICVDNDETFVMSLFRRAFTSLTLTYDIQKMVIEGFDPSSLKDMLDKAKSIFTVNLQSAWYQGLLYIDSLIALQEWTKFEDFIRNSNLKSDPCFLQGVSLRLEQIACTTNDKDIQSGSIRYLRYLSGCSYETVQNLSLDVLQNLGISVTTDRSTSNAIGQIITNQFVTVINPLDRIPPVWDRFWYTPRRSALLIEIEQKERNGVIIDSLPALFQGIHDALDSKIDKVLNAINPDAAELSEVREAFEEYYSKPLQIQTISGVKELEECFINLAIVEAPNQRRKDKEGLLARAATFHRLDSYENVTGTNLSSQIQPDELFKKRILRSRAEGIPRKILIHGRAGIGKTTLCKKIVQLFQSNLWGDHFDIVLWISLRELKDQKDWKLHNLIEKFFVSQEVHTDKFNALVKAVKNCIAADRALFVLDGYDEILPSMQDNDTKRLIGSLLAKKNVILTSRPSAVDSKLISQMGVDLELETVGFSAKNVSDYISMACDSKTAMNVNDFIQQTPLIQGLVNIPVQLNVMCACWDPNLSQDLIFSPTMTKLYQMMVDKLWRMHAIREGHVEEDTIENLTAKRLEASFFSKHTELLEYIAFKGMKDHHKLEFNEPELGLAAEELHAFRCKNGKATDTEYDIKLVGSIKRTPILNTADIDSDLVNGERKSRSKSWHFLHLTYQEFFAARWLVRHFDSGFKSVSFNSTGDVWIFIQENKYNSQYEIVWRMVAGMLEGDHLEKFFSVIRSEPKDLLGGRHQLLLAGCLKEVKSTTTMSTELSNSIEKELMQWLNFEMRIHGNCDGCGALVTQNVFPEVLLLRCQEETNVDYSTRVYALKALKYHRYLTSKTIASLLKVYEDGDSTIQVLVIEIFGAQSRLSDPTVRFLLEAMRSENRDKMVSAADALRKQSTLSKDSIQRVSRALSIGDDYIRFSVAEALSLQDSLTPSIVLELIKLLQEDLYSHVRCSAVKALGVQPNLSPDSALALKKALQDKEISVQIAAAVVLRNHSLLPKEIVLELIKLLKEKDHRIRDVAEAAVRNQSKLEESATLELVQLLLDNDPTQRNIAVDLLSKQQQLSRATIYNLIYMIWSTTLESSQAASHLLSNLSTLPDFAILATISALNSGDPNFHQAARDNLQNYNLKEEEIADFIKGKVDSWNPNTPRKPRDNSTTLILTDALDSPFAFVGAAAIKILSSMPALPVFAVRRVILTIHKNEFIIKESIVKALGDWLDMPQAAFKEFITDPSPTAAEDIRSDMERTYFIALTDALLRNDSNVRETAVNGLQSQKALPDNVTEYLIEKPLRHWDQNVRIAASNVLSSQSSFTDNTIEKLSRTFDESISDIKKTIVGILGSQISLQDNGINILVDALSDKDPNVRESAVMALHDQLSLKEYAVNALANAMNDCDIEVRLLAIQAVGSQEELSEDSYISLICLLFDKDEEVVMASMKELRLRTSMPEGPVMGLLGALQYGNYRLRDLAGELLLKQSRLPEPVIATLVYSIQDRNEYIRESAIKILHKQTSLDGEPIQNLLSIMHKGHYASPTPNNHRISAAAVLAKQDTLSEQALILLYNALNDPDQHISTYAARALGNQMILPESLSAVITKNLENRKSILRRLAPRIIGYCRNDSEFAVLLSTIALQSDNFTVRKEAMEFLKVHSLLPRYTLLNLTNMIGSVEKDMKRSIIEVLCQQGELAEGVVLFLYSVLEEEGHPGMWRLAEGALTSQPNLSPAAVADFAKSLRSQDVSIACISAKILGSQQNLSITEITCLVEHLNNPVKDIRDAVVDALRFQVTQSESAIKLLVSTLKSTSHEARSFAARILGCHHSLPEVAVRALIKVLMDTTSDIRERCIISISKQAVLSENTAGVLISCLRDYDNDIRITAKEGLIGQKKLPVDAIHILVDGLRNEEQFFMDTAVEILSEQDSLTTSVEELLSDALNDKEDDYRARAVRILFSQTSLGESTIKQLSKTLESKDAYLRGLVIEVLSEQEILPEDTIKSLIDASNDIDIENRQAIVRLLGKHPKYFELTAGVFIKASQDRCPEVRELAAEAVFNASIYVPNQEFPLDAYPYDSNSQLMTKEHPVLRHISALRSGNDEECDQAIAALAMHSPLPPSSCVSLVTLLHSSTCTSEVKRKILSLLGDQLELPRAVFLDIARALNDDLFSLEIKIAAAEVLCKHSLLPNATIDALTSALKGNTEVSVRRLAAKAICIQSSTHVKSGLIEALHDDDSEVRNIAIESIGTKGVLVALLDMDKVNIEHVYKNVLFPLSCRNPVSLYIDKEFLYIHTEYGPEKHDKLTTEQVLKIKDAFERVQSSYGISVLNRQIREE